MQARRKTADANLDPLEGLPPFRHFEEASQAVLRYLEERLGFGLWLVTRTEGDDWTVLSAQDSAYDVQSGDRFSWSDTFCSRMVQGRGPRAAPRVQDVPAFVEAPIGRELTIRSYLGVPLVQADGSLFGTLCAIDPRPKPDEICDDLPLVELLARLLSTQLQRELHVQSDARKAERAEIDALRDPLTRLYDRQAWDCLVEVEETRCVRYGNPAVVLKIDLDDLATLHDRNHHVAGDRLILEASETLHEICRPDDVLARLEDDGFAWLGVETRPTEGSTWAERMREALSAAGIESSVGWAGRRPSTGIPGALQRATRRLYEDRHRKKPAPE